MVARSVRIWRGSAPGVGGPLAQKRCCSTRRVASRTALSDLEADECLGGEARVVDGLLRHLAHRHDRHVLPPRVELLGALGDLFAVRLRRRGRAAFWGRERAERERGHQDVLEARARRRAPVLRSRGAARRRGRREPQESAAARELDVARVSVSLASSSRASSSARYCSPARRHACSATVRAASISDWSASDRIVKFRLSASAASAALSSGGNDRAGANGASDRDSARPRLASFAQRWLHSTPESEWRLLRPPPLVAVATARARGESCVSARGRRGDER